MKYLDNIPLSQEPEQEFRELTPLKSQVRGQKTTSTRTILPCWLTSNVLHILIHHIVDCVSLKVFPLVFKTHMHLKGNVNHMFDIHLHLTMFLFSIKKKNVN